MSQSISAPPNPAGHIECDSFAPFGGAFPTMGQDQQDALINMLYLQDEIIRWDKSIAWINDNAASLDEAGTLRSIIDVARHLVTDKNAPSINSILLQLPIHLRRWQTCIIPNIKTKRELWDDLSLTLVEACTSLLQFCQEGRDDADLLVLKSLDMVARDCLMMDKKSGVYKGKIEWTKDDIELEKEEVHEMMQKVA